VRHRGIQYSLASSFYQLDRKSLVSFGNSTFIHYAASRKRTRDTAIADHLAPGGVAIPRRVKFGGGTGGHAGEFGVAEYLSAGIGGLERGGQLRPALDSVRPFAGFNFAELGGDLVAERLGEPAVGLALPREPEPGLALSQFWRR
jgi:hypothetical protein